ncbi:helix-turn-helix domain-containing protein [Mangrovimonas sp. YM274]|uniref:helix-turn-helix domain-containing protein n=1 Tax=Mangrovimonas sp. YM274 TaxID=3070660 RepID=UPI0027DBBC40|nr:helix-turn-helix domain-containing protein [Mangrovimonas sp. YM274]WMI70109.1 helix-turn-helix domain-containing protein [Mangrovimonas sp. YM274]
MASQLSMDQNFVERLKAVLESNFSNEHFGVQELADEVGLSRSQLHRKLNALLGKSSSQFIREYRLERALEMLKNEETTASEIAYRVGFNSPTYFNTCFSDFYGYTPGEVKFKKSEASNNDIGLKTSASKNTKKTFRRKRKFTTLFWVSSVALVLLLGYTFYMNSKTNIETVVEPQMEELDKTVAVLPFKNLSHHPENAYFADAIREDIINNLSKVEQIIVKSRQSTEKYRASSLSAKDIGEALDANYIVGGSVQKEGQKIRIRVHLINSKTDVQLWAKDFDRDYKDLFTLESEISKQIVSELNLVLSPFELELIDKAPTDNLEAYNLYMKAVYYGVYEEDIHLARSYLNSCLEIEPNFAVAYSGLAISYLWENWPNPTENDILRAKDYAEKAIKLDNKLSEPHRVLGWVYLSYDWDWKRTESQFEKAISLNPNNYFALFMYSQYLQYSVGDFERARKMLDRAQLIAPDSFRVSILSSELYLHQGDFNNALRQAERAEEQLPKDAWPFWVKFKIYTALGEYDLAYKQLEISWAFEEEGKEKLPLLWEAYMEAGIKGVYKWINDMDIEHLKSQGTLYNNAYWIAQKFAYLEEDAKVLEWLETAFERKNAELYKVKYDPYFEKLHNNPEFLKFLKKMNLGNYEIKL